MVETTNVEEGMHVITDPRFVHHSKKNPVSGVMAHSALAILGSMVLEDQPSTPRGWRGFRRWQMVAGTITALSVLMLLVPATRVSHEPLDRRGSTGSTQSGAR